MAGLPAPVNYDFDVLVIGAGVIGLVTARELASRGRSVLLAEREDTFGQHTSSRNTGVIHAGVYYEPGTLKARLCLDGRQRLFEYCRSRNVPHGKIGKLFIATCEEALPGLDKILDRAGANGIDGCSKVSQGEISKREPAIKALEGVFCPHTGIVDTHQYMLSLLADCEAAGVVFSGRTEVVDAEPEDGGWSMCIRSDGDNRVRVGTIVNAAGLSGLELAKRVFPKRELPDAAPSKGAFVRLLGKSPVSCAIYPDLNPGVILPRVDATPGLDGICRFGPASDPAESPADYSCPDGLIDRQIDMIRRYLPDIRKEDLALDFVGVRPKVAVPPRTAADFRFDWANGRNWLDLINMESPGLTASLAISTHVGDLLDQRT